MSFKRHWLTIPQLADRWNMPISEIIHFISTGQIPISIVIPAEIPPHFLEVQNIAGKETIVGQCQKHGLFRVLNQELLPWGNLIDLDDVTEIADLNARFQQGDVTAFFDVNTRIYTIDADPYCWVNVLNFVIDISDVEALVVEHQFVPVAKEASANIENEAQAAPVKETDQPETPESMVERLRDAGEPDGVIAVLLAKTFDHSAYNLMKAIQPGRVVKWESLPAKVGRPKQWFADLRKKGENILNDRKK